MEGFISLAVARMVLVLTHVFSFVAAAGAVAFGDYAIFSRPRIDTTLLGQAVNVVTAALATLWLTGIGIVWLDTGFDVANVMSRPKLLAKLTVVTLLTLNGIALHRLGFPRLRVAHRDPRRAAVLPAALGAISLTSWLYAAFIGLGTPVATLLGYRGFMLIYGAAVATGIAIALGLVRPRLARQLKGRVAAS